MIIRSSRNLRHVVFGDRRDQRLALREAGFESEVTAAAWGREALRAAGVDPESQVEAIALLRRERRDLTLRTAAYIAHHCRIRAV